MSFYLLKPTNDRENMGDTVFLKSDVFMLEAQKVITKKETYFTLQVFLKGGSSVFKTFFNTEKEIKHVMKDLSNNFKEIDEMVMSVKSCIEKEEALERLQSLIS